MRIKTIFHLGKLLDNKMNTRAIATQIILEVVTQGRALSMPAKLQVSSLDRAFIQSLCYGVIRWYMQLETIAEQLIQKPLKEKDKDIHVLILVGLYQLIHMRIPDYAAVGETVAATKVFKKVWAKNLVNGVLRQYLRSADEITHKLQNAAVVLYSHPQWMLQKIKHQWPDQWKEILEANNQHPPFALRVNQRVISREQYCSLLTDTVGENHIIPEAHSGVVLKNPVDVLQLPRFAEGGVSVQDGAAQLAAELLLLEPGQRVLDACAAPGGKTSHILEIQPQLSELIAIDCDEIRLESVRENLQRLHLSAQCITSDVGNLSAWWDQKPFDRILLDAPCSASGVIRRHPDIKLLRRESDLIQLVSEQYRIISAVWQALKIGGVLLYATCSIFIEENEQVVRQFLETHTDAKEEKINVEWGKECKVGRQILPGMHGMDGFYYARLRKCM
jgi:16S rRNA (cytosine967-C5)-methyltransferase